MTLLAEMAHMLVRPVRANTPIAETPTGRIATQSLTAGRDHILRQDATHASPSSSCHGLGNASKLCIGKLVDGRTGGTCVVPQAAVDSWKPRAQQIFPGESLCLVVLPLLYSSYTQDSD